MPGRGRGRPPHAGILTPAEQRVLEELRRGGTNVEIAVRLGLSPETVKTHIASMLGKLGLDDRHTLASWRPDRDRTRFPALLALPPAFASLGRPLLWAGTAFGGMAIVAVVVVLLVTLLGYEEEERMVLPHTLTATATGATTQFEALPAPELTLVSRGEHDALKLEWTGGPTNVTTWQYRQRSWQDGRPLEWGDWTDIPSSGAATRGYRLTGLTERTGYSVELRGVVGPLTGPASNSVSASTHHRTNHPEMYPGDVVEGDGQTEWRLHRLGVLITIPAGKRLTVGQGSIAHGWVGIGDDRWLTLGQVDLYDEVTGSVLVLDSDTGREVLRRVVEEPESDTHDANALFDQIVASVRVD